MIKLAIHQKQKKYWENTKKQHRKCNDKKVLYQNYEYV